MKGGLYIETDQGFLYMPSNMHNGKTSSCSPGVGGTKPIFSYPVFSTFSVIVKTNVSYWISRLNLADVTAAQLQGHLSNMNVIQGI